MILSFEIQRKCLEEQRLRVSVQYMLQHGTLLTKALLNLSLAPVTKTVKSSENLIYFHTSNNFQGISCHKLISPLFSDYQPVVGESKLTFALVTNFQGIRVCP